MPRPTASVSSSAAKHGCSELAGGSKIVVPAPRLSTLACLVAAEPKQSLGVEFIQAFLGGSVPEVGASRSASRSRSPRRLLPRDETQGINSSALCGHSSGKSSAVGKKVFPPSMALVSKSPAVGTISKAHGPPFGGAASGDNPKCLSVAQVCTTFAKSAVLSFSKAKGLVAKQYPLDPPALPSFQYAPSVVVPGAEQKADTGVFGMLDGKAAPLPPPVPTQRPPPSRPVPTQRLCLPSEPPLEMAAAHWLNVCPRAFVYPDQQVLGEDKPVYGETFDGVKHCRPSTSLRSASVSAFDGEDYDLWRESGSECLGHDAQDVHGQGRAPLTMPGTSRNVTSPARFTNDQ